MTDSLRTQLQAAIGSACTLTTEAGGGMSRTAGGSSWDTLPHVLRRGACGVAFVLSLSPALSHGQPMPVAPLTAAAVRAARAHSNAAIAARDTAALIALASTSYHSVSSRNVHTNGRAGIGAQYDGQFSAHPDVSFVRTPHEVRVYAPWEMADERGTWVGTWTEPDGRVTIRGRYSAKWRRIRGAWLLETEVFTPLSCRGSSYCTRPPDQPK